MAPKLLKTESQGARQCKTAQSSAGRASPALPVSSRRGGRQRPRPVKSQPLTSLGAGRRVPDSPRGVRSALAARAECPGLPQPRTRPGRPYLTGMLAEAKVAEPLRLLEEAGCLDLVVQRGQE
ncbi:hypothetical protein NDU88_006412 [Pleurodeles waltl]|uniref:Uncharacterized protein n=1 Tax=Pleurodeles waltl TaxID=8319 RepID=A0AAV7PLQ4_PLEWA|nr:hypothetical protein NDU88_006412 [Pleurodeles waltl]